MYALCTGTKDDQILEDGNSCSSKNLSATKHNTYRREKRAKETMKNLRTSLSECKHIIKKQREQLDKLSTVNDEYKELLSERNSEIIQLKTFIRQLEQEEDVLQCELGDVLREKKEDQCENQAVILELKTELERFQQNAKLETLSSGTYSASVRELYYSLLSFRIPPAQIKPVVQNVLKHMQPSLNVDKLRLPGKSCASYMRSSEMSVLSTMHKSTELTQQQEWHLNRWDNLRSDKESCFFNQWPRIRSM